MPSRQHEIVKYGAFKLHKWLSLDMANIGRIRKLVNYANFALRMPKDVAVKPLMIDHIPAEWLIPKGIEPNPKGPVLLFFHGGGYLIGSLESHRSLFSRIAQEIGWPALHIDYRLAPEHPFPAALEDGLRAYEWLQEQGFSPERIAMGGDSAGGGLVLATMLELRERNLELPAASICMSPWVDLSFSGHSAITHAKYDPIVIVPQVHKWAMAYAGDYPLDHPEVSPLYANLKKLPPVLIQVSSLEVLTDDAYRLAEKLQKAKVDVTLQVWDATLHVWQLFWRRVPESQEAIEKAAQFLREKVMAQRL